MAALFDQPMTFERLHQASKDVADENMHLAYSRLSLDEAEAEALLHLLREGTSATTAERLITMDERVKKARLEVIDVQYVRDLADAYQRALYTAARLQTAGGEGGQ